MKTTLLLALTLVVANAHATDPQPTTSTGVETMASAGTEPVAAAPQVDPNEKICKVERELGSNKMKRVCRTRAQIEIDREAAREALSREQRR